MFVVALKQNFSPIMSPSLHPLSQNQPQKNTERERELNRKNQIKVTVENNKTQRRADENYSRETKTIKKSFISCVYVFCVCLILFFGNTKSFYDKKAPSKVHLKVFSSLIAIGKVI